MANFSTLGSVELSSANLQGEPEHPSGYSGSSDTLQDFKGSCFLMVCLGQTTMQN